MRDQRTLVPSVTIVRLGIIGVLVEREGGHRCRTGGSGGLSTRRVRIELSGIGVNPSRRIILVLPDIIRGLPMALHKGTVFVSMRVNPFLTPGAQRHQQKPTNECDHEFFHKRLLHGGRSKSGTVCALLKIRYAMPQIKECKLDTNVKFG